MTTISATIVADSISPDGVRLTTFSLKYPRFFHAEVMTHRAIAKSFSSSRAIPTHRMLKSIEENPVIPLHIGKHQSGMQAYERVVDKRALGAIHTLWKDAMRASVQAAHDMTGLFGVHKQVASRAVEPWAHIQGIVSATDFENFFALRCHPAAEPHFRALAWKIADLYYGSEPNNVGMGGWHLPYLSENDWALYSLEDLKKFSAARCARVSYNNHDGSAPNPENDLKLFERLTSGLTSDDPLEPNHLSPLEHQATPLADPRGRSGPFRGWKQHRKEFHGENMAFDYQAAIDRGWREDALSIFKTE